MSEFEVKTEQFEGPLDLLLTLIERNKLHITDFSLAGVTDDFLRYIEGNQSLKTDTTSQFLVVASTLLLIKSRALLPYIDLSAEEEETIEELEVRLKIYKEIKEIGIKIEELYGQSVIFQLNPPQQDIEFGPGINLSQNSIYDAVQSVVKQLPKEEKTPQTKVQKMISLEDVIERLEKKIKRAITMTFKEFVNSDKDKSNSKLSDDQRSLKIEVVVSFLALLELVKQGIMSARQEGKFGEISIESSELGVPEYGNQ